MSKPPTDFSIDYLQRIAKQAGYSNSLLARKKDLIHLSAFFGDWDINELAALMQALKLKYDPLLTEVIAEMDKKAGL